MQILPYVIVTNSHLYHVYELYYQAFEKARRIPPITSLEENDQFCDLVRDLLTQHLTVIPQLVMGVIEVEDLMERDETDALVTSMLRSVSLIVICLAESLAQIIQRISRRVIAEQHIALTETYYGSRVKGDVEASQDNSHNEFIGTIFLNCKAKELVQKCAVFTRDLMQKTYGDECKIPEIKLHGHVDATFPYIPSHVEYIIGELLRNSIQATVERGIEKDGVPPPIDVLIVETSQDVMMRFSDRGGGIPLDILPHIWSFSKGPRRKDRLRNLRHVPQMSATLEEVRSEKLDKNVDGGNNRNSSLSSLTSRPPDLKLDMGLPMSKIYAQYWAGSLHLHNLEGYGVDIFLQISKLGNQNERITTRASMDAV